MASGELQFSKQLEGNRSQNYKTLECDGWCELGIRLDAPWKGGSLGLVANSNGHHWEPTFNNGDRHHHLHIDTLQTFLARLHEQKRILNRLLKHVS
jgi:hypothetical protein